VTLLNQSVLLRGVNDNANTLADLSNALFDAGVMPYYLHVLDKVQERRILWSVTKRPGDRARIVDAGVRLFSAEAGAGNRRGTQQDALDLGLKQQ
jgi:hypothetical protein